MEEKDDGFAEVLDLINDFKLHTLAEMLFVRICKKTGEDRRELLREWIETARKNFDVAMDMEAINTGSTIWSNKMRRAAEKVWKKGAPPQSS